MRTISLFLMILLGALHAAQAIQVTLVNMNPEGLTEWNVSLPKSSSPITYKNLRAKFSVGYEGYIPLTSCTVPLKNGNLSFSTGELHYPAPHPLWSWFFHPPRLKMEMMVDEIIGNKPLETYGFDRYISLQDNAYSATIFFTGLHFHPTELATIDYTMIHQRIEHSSPPSHSFFLTRWMNTVIELLSTIRFN